MLIKLMPEISQIRWHINAVLADFETLKHDPDTMVAAAKGELETLLDYLKAIESTNQIYAILRPCDGYAKLDFKSIPGDNQFSNKT